MSKKPKFRPKITRIKLNPEQAVLSCACYMANTVSMSAPRNHEGNWCMGFTCIGVHRVWPPTCVIQAAPTGSFHNGVLDTQVSASTQSS